FERAVSSREFSGLGLGLYISRQIVQEHGGDIRVESVSGQGSTFCVELPLRSPPHRGLSGRPGDGERGGLARQAVALRE
ncbi:MAG TPA: ATP-binding protein, partial [Hyalangium sp.]|nr:ATP-binding protein [Hyalangium sp.]